LALRFYMHPIKVTANCGPRTLARYGIYADNR
jgi:hypothetical protein